VSGGTDRGLDAVRRVRAVRETDSRIGLRRALAEAHESLSALDRAERALSVAEPAPALEPGSALLARRAAQLELGADAARARRAAEAAVRMSDTARAHWISDHARLSAVTALLERRREERRAERARVEARELDEVAGRSWLRAGADRGERA
jgi:flagellar export protein FliJ